MWLCGGELGRRFCAVGRVERRQRAFAGIVPGRDQDLRNGIGRDRSQILVVWRLSGRDLVVCAEGASRGGRGVDDAVGHGRFSSSPATSGRARRRPGLGIHGAAVWARAFYGRPAEHPAIGGVMGRGPCSGPSLVVRGCLLGVASRRTEVKATDFTLRHSRAFSFQAVCSPALARFHSIEHTNAAKASHHFAAGCGALRRHSSGKRSKHRTAPLRRHQIGMLPI